MCYFPWKFSSHFIYPVWYYTMHFQIVLLSKWFFPFSLLLITKYIYYFVSIVWCHSITSVTLSFIAIYQMKCWFIFLAWRAHNLYFHAQNVRKLYVLVWNFPPLIITFVFELAMSLVRVDMCFKPIQTLKFYFSDLKNPEIQQKLISEALEMLDTCSFQMGAILYSFDHHNESVSHTHP